MNDQPVTVAGPDKLSTALRWVLAALGAALLLFGAWYVYAWLVTPAALRHPTTAHYHFRMQIINGGQAVNFSEAAYQNEFNADICSAALTKQPIHFHDNLDQFVHIHWSHITGGTVLKNYGWNFLGGTKYTLGYRFDHFPKLVRVPIHGLNLPTPPIGANYYVYTGTSESYRQRDFRDFIDQDLEDFFAGRSVGWLQRLVPEATAADDEQLTKLNHVLGNVVIFAQEQPPTAAQVKARFDKLVPLPESVCGG